MQNPNFNIASSDRTVAKVISNQNAGKPKLLDQVRHRLRAMHVAKRTEEAYVGWINRYLLFAKEKHGSWVHPAQLGNDEINAFLTHLAVERKVAASTQNQALSALLFLYTKILDLEFKIDAIRAKKPVRLPTVLTQSEVASILGLIPHGSMFFLRDN